MQKTLDRMDYIVKKNQNKHLLILVHGLNGSGKTWKGTEERFCENLEKESLIQDNFDVALFNYGTTIFKVNWISRIARLLKGFFGNRPKEEAKSFNVGIDKASMPLVAQLNGIHSQYDTISFVAHSMGGLITKNALTWLDSNILKKVYFFMSLSVPHIGAHLATIGSKIPVLGENPQIIGLRAMGSFTTSLNQRFSNLNPQPKIVYQYGIYDDVVPESSAYPANVPNNLTVATEDDHFSVVLISDTQNNTVFKRILDELYIVTLPFIGIDVGIPDNVTFELFIETITSRLELVTIDFQGFDKKELEYTLKPGNISSTDFRDFIIQIGNKSIKRLPKYSVIQERGTLNFTLKTD